MKSQLLLFLFAAAATHGQPKPSNASILVDFSKTKTVNTVSGLVAGADGSTPLEARAKPLNLGLWRVTSLPGALEAAQSNAATTQIVLSDFIGYPVSGWGGNGGKPPYADWSAYESRLRSILPAWAGKRLMIDVWNEPDNPYFWNGTREQFFEAYLRAYRVIRQVLGASVLVGGPSLARPYDKAYITAFLDYCLRQGCEVNSLSWHELDDSDRGLFAIASHVQDARTSFVNNTRYSALKLQRIDLNEIIGPFYTNKPGPTIAYFDQAEKGGADSAARTCWTHSRSGSECFNGSLDGLLTHDTKQPRPNWWVHRYYGQGVGVRVSSTTNDWRIVSLASGTLPGTRTAQILVGYVNSATVFTQQPAEISLTLNLSALTRLSFLNGATSVLVTVERIPDLGERQLDQPVTMYTLQAPINNSTATATLTGIRAAEAYRIILSNPLG